MNVSTSSTSSTSAASPLICWIQTTDDAPLALVGGKGANLVRLARAGFPVPDGFIITTAAYRAFVTTERIGQAQIDPAQLQTRISAAPISADLGAQILAAFDKLGAPTVAVRSSGTAEDLASASFAGQHDTFLDVSGAEALLTAVRACWASLWSPRAVAYRREHGWGDGNEYDPDLALAVVVQRMIPSDAAGVVFTANPLTGDRAETVISAVRGLGERLVSGQGQADEWVVRSEQATHRRNVEGALDATQALAVAQLARQITDAFGSPQDIEWAFSGGDLFALQARPITALPEPISWRTPTKGGWMRNFRLGEWLPEPVTPLFASWPLHQIEAGEVAAEARDFGLRLRPPHHILVNGWYFTSAQGGVMSPTNVASALLRHPRRIAAFILSVFRPELGERTLFAPQIEEWRKRLLPAYQRLVANWQSQVETATPAELARLVDQIATTAGTYLWSFSVIGGNAWKVERSLARFYRRYLVAIVGRSHQELLRGLTPPTPQPPPHAVQSLDWIQPTAGERIHTAAGTADESAARYRRLQEERQAAEQACRNALADRLRLRRRFDRLSALAQRYAVIREEQAAWFTLGWPVMRRAALRLGEELRSRGAIERAEDVFFLTRTEVAEQLQTNGAVRQAHESANLRGVVVARQQEWQRQRRLTPPLTLGKPAGAQLIARTVETMRVPHGHHDPSATLLTGMPASPGRASGPARIVRGPEDFDRFEAGEVLVAQVTAPAWTPLFERAAAVITDGGSVAAHASLVAREYGIPAVVGVGDATAQLHDGQRVTVDGSAGVVEVTP